MAYEINLFPTSKKKLKKGKMHYLFLKYFKYILVAYILHLYTDMYSI